MDAPVLSARGLTKIYNGNAAVNNITLTVNKGDIYGFVGLNGSGKTTFIRMVTSLIKVTGGEFELFGEQGNKIQSLKRISSMVETPSIYQNLTALENLYAQCRVAGLEKNKIAETSKTLLELVGLADTGKKVAKNFSLGMRQRLGIAMALVGNPEFMLLDEPTNGLDPAGIIEIRELLLTLNRERGITILISSHILAELDKLATRYGFIHKGKLIQEITAEEMHEKCAVNKRLILEVDNVEKAAAAFTAKKIEFRQRNNAVRLPGDITVSEAFRILESAKVNILAAETKIDDLETYFMELIREANQHEKTL